MKFTIAFILLMPVLYAQKTGVNENAGIDKKAMQIPDSLTKTTNDISLYIRNNFNTDKEKVRAIFIWTANNIQYDVENMFAINFYEKREEKIAKPLRTRKGICENFAALFTDICLKAGIESYVIDGYTKQNGFADYTPHAWCAAFVDSTWYMFDPTWGSGYVSGGKFYRQINSEYFKASPSTFIKSHMPFDFLWQFLNYPITNQEFYEGKTQQIKTKPFFSYTDSIQAYVKLNAMEKLIASAERIERNGIKNSLIFDRLQHIKLEIEHDRQTQIINLYNSGASDYTDGVNLLNDFINFRNKQFIPAKADAEIQSMLDKASAKLNAAKGKLAEIKNPDANVSGTITQVLKSIDDAEKLLKEQQDWLKEYLSKGKAGRKSMFYETKMTWFGIPITK